MNLFKNIKNPKVLKEIDVYDFLNRVANPDEEVKQKTLEARKVYYIDKNKYDVIKGQLPCFTLNFNFNESKRNSNIKSPTGFIYVDIDGTTEINLENDFIYASWLSLSGTGRGILVKVEGLTLDNFNETYSKISELLNVQSDIQAKKATQFCVNSYDENIYINEDSTTYHCKEVINNSPNTVINKKEKRVNTKMGENIKLRFDNISDYDFNNEDYIVFWDDKEIIPQVFVPRIIPNGKRESCLSAIAYQFRALNPEITEFELLHFISSINQKKCFPPLNSEEVLKIVRNKMKLSEIEPLPNKERRILFNPNKHLSRLEKIAATNQILAELKMVKSRNKIRSTIDNWNYEELGKITQEKLAKESGLNIKTIEKYYCEFKPDINHLNKIALRTSMEV